jgi:hypothetical protein
MTRLIFVGESWQGSCARSLREALAGSPAVAVRDIALDAFIPVYRQLPLRITNRVLRRLQRGELRGAILEAIADFRPDALVVYKGAGIDAGLLTRIRDLGTPVVNVFPDCSPHAHGREIEEALGLYDLAISTKPFHPQLWRSEYGYRNPCVFVPHGYDSAVHLWSSSSTSQIYDVALCGNWRPEYHRLMKSFAEALSDDCVSVAVAGPGWIEHRHELPRHWQCVGPRLGRGYGEFVRSARIVIAPVSREVVVRGVEQHGDEDTTRTYELAAAHCFFLHQRTHYIGTVYDEATEVPLWGDAEELASLVRRWLPDDVGRHDMAGRAHARAVPTYSIVYRAQRVLEHIEALIEKRPLVTA